MVKIDVASERQPRQDKSGGFFEKRDGGRGGRSYDRPARGDDRYEYKQDGYNW